MDVPVVAVVLAGGTGTRLYPASRPTRPKQFLAFGGDDSLLARTVERCGFADEVAVLTTERLADEAAEHAPSAEILVEPAPRDTGPALLYAAGEYRDRHGDCVVLGVPSDHVVGTGATAGGSRGGEREVESDRDGVEDGVGEGNGVGGRADEGSPDGGFAEVARRAAAVARETGGVVTLGIEPTRPATEYGYIEPGADRGGYREVAGFREKPDAGTAEALVEADCLWNAGVFAGTPAGYLAAARGTPLDPLVDAIEAGEPDRGFAAVEPVSFDRGVLERAAGLAVVPADLAWDDLGSWDALRRVLAPDADGNVTLGDALALDAGDNVIASDDAHVAVVGVDDLVVAAFDDRVLVVPADDAQRVRAVVAELRDRGLY